MNTENSAIPVSIPSNQAKPVIGDKNKANVDKKIDNLVKHNNPPNKVNQNNQNYYKPITANAPNVKKMYENPNPIPTPTQNLNQNDIKRLKSEPLPKNEQVTEIKNKVSYDKKEDNLVKKEEVEKKEEVVKKDDIVKKEEVGKKDKR